MAFYINSFYSKEEVKDEMKRIKEQKKKKERKKKNEYTTRNTSRI